MRDRTIVVGAGVGGLVSAALLAARGHAVTVIDSQPAPGGKLRALDGIDAGPTVFTMRGVFDEIFAECGADLEGGLAALFEQDCAPAKAGAQTGFPPSREHKLLRPATILARHAWNDARLDLHADPAASESAIATFAGPENAKGYRAFRAEAKRIHDALDRPFMRRSNTNPIALGFRMGLSGFRDYATLRPYTSLWSALGRYFPDPRLQQLFGRYATYCGSSPFAAPATLMLIAHVEASGVWLIEGGMHRLALALEALGKANGVRFRYDSPVAEIATERGRASGVVLQSGERLTADSVVLNADPAHGFGHTAQVAPRHRSLSALVWLSETKATGFPLARHNVLFSPDYPAEFAALASGKLPTDPSVYVCAQDRADDAPAPTGPERVQIIVNAPATADTNPLTSTEIERCTHAMQARLGLSGLHLDLPPATTRLLRPREFEALNPGTGGALYGRASHGWAASFLRQGSRTRTPGLYCAGGSTHPGAGVPMAALSGVQAVDCLLRDRASTSSSRPRAMPGGISTPSARTAATG